MRSDLNHRIIVDALRAAGATVTVLSNSGLPGLPDLLVGYGGHNLLMEVKNRSGGNRLSLVQKDWLRRWAGQACVVYDEQDALSVLYGTFE
jgi:Holliday junction resolvase